MYTIKEIEGGQSLFRYNILVLIHRNLWSCYYLYCIFRQQIKMTPIDSSKCPVPLLTHCFLIAFADHATFLVLGDAQVIPHLGLGFLMCRVKWWHSVVFKVPFSSNHQCFSVWPALIGLSSSHKMPAFLECTMEWTMSVYRFKIEKIWSQEPEALGCHDCISSPTLMSHSVAALEFITQKRLVVAPLTLPLEEIKFPYLIANLPFMVAPEILISLTCVWRPFPISQYSVMSGSDGWRIKAMCPLFTQK